jgi:hypothetical protein
MNLTAPVEENTELENSDSNHLRKDILVHNETPQLALLVVLIFAVGRTLIFVERDLYFFVDRGLYFGLMVSFWTMGRVGSDFMSMWVWVVCYTIVSFKLILMVAIVKDNKKNLPYFIPSFASLAVPH